MGVGRPAVGFAAVAVVAVVWLPPTSSVGHEYFTKYPQYDGYVTSCSKKEVTYGAEETLEVRRFLPTFPSRFDNDPAVYHTTSEGTLIPFDQSPISGWCGEDVAGDRVSFLIFDLTDFSESAISGAELRLTPKAFPIGGKVEIRGACTSNWYEESLTWVTAPFVTEGRDNTTLCTWESQDDLLYYDGPLSCDITGLARNYAGSHLCLSLDMPRTVGNPRDPVVFWSRDVNEAKARSTAVFTDPHQGNTVRTKMGSRPGFEFGTVQGEQESDSWRPHILFQGAGCGEYPDHHARDYC